MANIQKANHQTGKQVESVKTLATKPAMVGRFAEVLGGQEKGQPVPCKRHIGGQRKQAVAELCTG
mgnify:CR=1 FL=1